MKARSSISAVSYNEMPPEKRPAMDAIDAAALAQDFVARRMPIPHEVRASATKQMNEGMSPGWIAYLEEYLGRLRVVAIEK